MLYRHVFDKISAEFRGSATEFFPKILKGTNCPLGRFLKGQFQLQCEIDLSRITLQ